MMRKDSSPMEKGVWNWEIFYWIRDGRADPRLRPSLPRWWVSLRRLACALVCPWWGSLLKRPGFGTVPQGARQVGGRVLGT